MLELRALNKRYGAKIVLDSADLFVSEKSLTVVSGVPGNGKSVLARLICGLEEPDSGTIWLDGQNITSLSPGSRSIGYVPQSFALFPHYSVAANIGYPLKLAGVNKADVATKVGEVSAMLGVESILHKRVDQISGGQKQRVAMARGLVKRSALYILDDPLVGLDFKLREKLVEDLRLLQQELGATFLYLSSEPLEALGLADTVALLADGRFVETSDMPDAYLNPQHIATAMSLGFPRANRMQGRVWRKEGSTGITTAFFTAEVPVPQEIPEVVDLVIRPEDLRLLESPGCIHIPGELELVEDLGGESIVYLRCGNPSAILDATTGSDDPLLEGELTGVFFQPSDLMLFDPESGRRLEPLEGAQ